MDYQLQSRLVKLSSADAVEISPGQFQATFDSREMSNVQAVALKTAVYLNNVYNIAKDDDRHFRIRVASVDFTVSLTELGFYTLNQITAILQPLILAILNGVTPGQTFTMSVGTYSKKATVQASLVVIYGGLGLNTILGNTSSLSVPANTLGTFQDFADLNGLDIASVSITSKSPKTLLNSSATKMIYTNNIGVIPCTVPFGNQQTFINPSLEGTKVIFDHGEGLNQISWRLRDNKGEVILGQKEHLTLELVIWF